MDAIASGVNGVQVMGYHSHRLVEATQEAGKRSSSDLFLLATAGLGSIENEGSRGSGSGCPGGDDPWQPG
jgi:hypothetical protein